MKIIKNGINRLAATIGYTVVRLPTRLSPDARSGLDVLGGLVDNLVRSRGVENLFLLQIGANDGKDEDVVRPILERHRLQALLCEPLPDVFIKLQEGYAAREHVRLAQCAVGETDGELTLFRLVEGAAGDEGTKIASFDRSHVESYRRRWSLPPESLTTEAVACRTVNSLLEGHGRASADIAVVDTEGMDHLICHALLGLDPPPTIIHFEYSNSPIAEVRSLMKALTDAGYRFVRGGLDITAARDAMFSDARDG